MKYWWPFHVGESGGRAWHQRARTAAFLLTIQRRCMNSAFITRRMYFFWFVVTTPVLSQEAAFVSGDNALTWLVWRSWCFGFFCCAEFGRKRHSEDIIDCRERLRPWFFFFFSLGTRRKLRENSALWVGPSLGYEVMRYRLQVCARAVFINKTVKVTKHNEGRKLFPLVTISPASMLRFSVRIASFSGANDRKDQWIKYWARNKSKLHSSYSSLSYFVFTYAKSD